jgi:phosphoadenosine phosphosulfate reductase
MEQRMASESSIDRVAAARKLLHSIARDHPPAVFACSLRAEDMVLVDLIARDALPIDVFTLDTGRLPEETHALVDRVRDHYGIGVDVYFPERAAIQALVERHGVNGFYRSIEIRKACCGVRKVEPLGRALAGKRAWLTGLRREQSVDRGDVLPESHDEVHGLRKFAPLAWWTHDDVWDYLSQHDVPYNALHDRGYPSIGCAPCTRAVAVGDDPRSGRWWWEQEVRKECGLHPRATPLRVALAEPLP